MPPPLNGSDEVKPQPGMIARGVVLIPGIAICGVITAISLGVQFPKQRVFVYSYVEALVIAIVFGMAIRSLWSPSERWRSGIAKQMLDVAGEYLQSGQP